MPTLNWRTRDEDVVAAAKVPYRLLEEVPDLSFTERDPATENMLIQGDNLEALKSLLPFYAGKVKCIFIDPPYNTKSAVLEHYDDNLEHSQWLSLMYPRLELLRDLLCEDGLLFASIDEREGHYLKVLLDEIFGRQNFLTSFIWKKSYGGGAKAKWFVGLHEYIHCFGKNLEHLPPLELPPLDDSEKYYKFRDSLFESRGPYRLQPLATTSNDLRPNLRYSIPSPSGIEIWPKKQWQWSRDRVLAALAEDQLVFKNVKGEVSVSYKQYLLDHTGAKRTTKPQTIIDGFYTQRGTSESVELFGDIDKFSFPKPEGLIERLLSIGSAKGDLILDSFLGSGTTAAVAQKMGRRYIGIEMGNHAVTHCAPRLRKVIEGEQGGISESTGWKGGGGFRFYRLGPQVFDEQGRIREGIKFVELAAHIWFSETRTPRNSRRKSPLLGTHDGTAYYLLYNGVLGDRRPEGGNVLTRSVLTELPAHVGPRVVYGESCRLSTATLKRLGIVFKQTPYDVRAG